MSSSQHSGPRHTPSLSDVRIYIWIIVLHVLLFYPLVPLLSSTEQPRVKQLAVVTLVMVFALVHWLVMFRQPAWQARPDRMVPFLLLNLALTTALVWLDPSYTFLFLFTTGYAFRFLPLRWAVFITMLTAVLVVAERLGAFLAAPSPETLLQAFSNHAALLFSILVVAAIAQTARQSRERQVLLEQLQATQGELASAERQAGILEERARLAREIHDTLAQGLVSIVMHLQAAEDSLPTEGSPASKHIEEARRAARDNLDEARRFVWALQPEALERDALPKAVTRVAQLWSEENQIPVDVSVTGDPCMFPPEYEVTLLRAAQEALANVGKHAHARHVALTLSYMDDQLMMDVNDDGVGFDITEGNPDHQADGFGLAGMRQRVERLGGHLAIESAEGEGTTLAIEIPIVTRGERN